MFYCNVVLSIERGRESTISSNAEVYLEISDKSSLAESSQFLAFIRMAKCALLTSLFLLSSLASLQAERINSIVTKTSDCLFCGMVEGVGYLTVKVSRNGEVQQTFSKVNVYNVPLYLRCVVALTVVCLAVWTVTGVSTGCPELLTPSRDQSQSVSQNIIEMRVML